MFVRLFYTLRKYGIPVTTRELIDLNEAVSQGLVFADQDEFYQLVKTIMVKDERFFDKFDRAIKDYFLCTRQISQNPYPIRILPS